MLRNRTREAQRGSGSLASAAYIKSLTPAAWFRYGIGQTITGDGLSQWDDQSGNDRHLKQTTVANMPGDAGDGSVIFNGSTDYMKCDAFTLEQPETIYLLMKQITWTSNDSIADGNAADAARIFQSGSTPTIRLYAGAGALVNSGLAIDTYGVLTCVANGASSIVQVNHGTPATGDAGTNDMGGFTLGAAGSGLLFSNIQVKEAIVFAAAHDAATRARVISYLRRLGGV